MSENSTWQMLSLLLNLRQMKLNSAVNISSLATLMSL